MDGKRYWQSTVLWSIVFFLCVNAIIQHVNSFNKAALAVTTVQAVSGLAADFQRLKEPPYCVGLGSSVVNVPMGHFCLEHKDAAVPLPRKRACLVNDKLFASLALNGQMISDCYLLANEYLVAPREPVWLFFGLIPRDFIDPNLSSPINTTTFIALSQPSNWLHYVVLSGANLDNCLSSLAGQNLILFRSRSRFQLHALSLLMKVYSRFLPEWKPELAEGVLSKDAGGVDEYRYYYSHIVDSKLKQQFEYLERIISLCQNRRIKVLLVSMPVTGENFACMPPGFYTKFQKELASICRSKSGITFMDMAQDARFQSSDFSDSVHLNKEGTAKFFQLILPTLLPGADLPSTDFSSTNLPGADLPSTNLPAANLPGASSSGADLPDADSAQPKLSGATEH